MSDQNKYGVIMAGGIGSRFWPSSKEETPKQFIDILGTGQSFLQSTFERLALVIPKKHIYIVSNERYTQQILDQLPQIGENQIIAEPARRNTAPCLAYTAFKINQLNSEAVLFVAPSDHLILDDNEFKNTVSYGMEVASKQDCIVTLGIKPSFPHTGYGYINYDLNEDTAKEKKVIKFHEKPDFETAKSFVQQENFLWNSGMFIFSTKTIISSFSTLLPEIHNLLSDVEYNTDNEKEQIAKQFVQCEDISIDYGVMEKSDNVYVIPSYFRWNDLGTWLSLYDYAQKDEHKNVTFGDKTKLYDSSNNIIKQENPDKITVVHGLDNYIVVDTPKALYIQEKSDEKIIKTVLKDLKEEYNTKYI